MSENRKLPGVNGRMPPSSKSGKSNEASHKFNSSLRKCKKKKPFFMWGFLSVVVVGMVWFFISSHCDSLMLRKEDRLGDCEERARILLQRHNISKNQLHAFVSFFSVSDQDIMQSYVSELVAIQGYLALSIGCWWILVVITICYRLAGFPFLYFGIRSWFHS